MMMRLLCCCVLLAACAGAADEPVLDDADGSAEPDEAVEAVPSKPLCAGSPAPDGVLCQTLVYGDRGYCNRWVDCATLH